MPVQRRDPVRWLPGPLLGDARRALDQHEAVIGDIQDSQVGDDAVDDEYHGERQGTLPHDLEVSDLGDVLHPEITFPSLPAPRQSVDIAVAAARDQGRTCGSWIGHGHDNAASYLATKDLFAEPREVFERRIDRHLLEGRQ